MLVESIVRSESQRGRLTGKPGLAGLAQIDTRSDLDLDSRVKFDIYYNRNLSVPLYFKVLFGTIPYCVSCRSSYLELLLSGVLSYLGSVHSH